MKPRWDEKVPYCTVFGCDEYGQCASGAVCFEPCEPAIRGMTETLEALIAWDEHGGDAPEMPKDIVGWAKEAVNHEA